MQIGELFVNLGIKGAEKTIGALGEVKKGFSSLTSLSFEAKAGMVGALYALQRLVSTSGAMGTNLENFSALTDLSAESLQRWQYAARQAGVSGEEITGSIKGVQNAMSNILLGKGVPEGADIVSRAVGGLDPDKLRDTFYVMQKLQQAAKALPADVGNVALKSFGLSEGTIAAFRRGNFGEQSLKRAPIYGDKELASLDRANVAWSNLGNKIEMAMGHLNARHGGKLVSDISKVTDQILKLLDALVKIGEKLKVFEWIGKAFQGWAMILDKTTDLLNNGGIDKDTLGAVPGAFELMFKDFIGLFSPSVQPQQPGANKGNNQTTINQNLHFQHDGKDHKKIGDSVHKATRDAVRQMTVQGQGS